LLTVGIVMTFFMRPDIKLDAQPDDASGEHGLKLAEQSR
jgi:hypothetical protein